MNQGSQEWSCFLLYWEIHSANLRNSSQYSEIPLIFKEYHNTNASKVRLFALSEEIYSTKSHNSSFCNEFLRMREIHKKTVMMSNYYSHDDMLWKVNWRYFTGNVCSYNSSSVSGKCVQGCLRSKLFNAKLTFIIKSDFRANFSMDILVFTAT